MKRFTAIICTLALLTTFTGCDNSETSGSVPDGKNSVSATESTVNSVGSSDSENVPDNSESLPESEPVSNNTSSEPQKPVEEPTFLKGPDGEPIYPSDITFISIKDKTAPDGRRRADISELTEDNLAFVCCENFGYLQEPTGIRYNRYESPEKFESEFPYLYKGEELVNKNPIKRVYVGDEVCGMTISMIETTFVKARRDTSVPFWNDSILVKFKGEKTLTGYLSVESMDPDYPGTEGAVMFWPDEQGGTLPIADLYPGKNGAETSYHSGIGFYMDIGAIELGTIYDGGMTPANCDESLLDGITYGDKYVHVKITIDDYIAFGYGNNRAVLKSLERL